MIPAAIPSSRVKREPLPPVEPVNPIASSRSPTRVPLTMDSLLVAIGAQQVPAGEAHQVRFLARPVNWASELRGAIDLPPVLHLAEPGAHRRKRHEHEIEKGGSRPQQGDEQHTLDDDDAHTCAVMTDAVNRQFQRVTWDLRRTAASAGASRTCAICCVRLRRRRASAAVVSAPLAIAMAVP